MDAIKNIIQKLKVANDKNCIVNYLVNLMSCLYVNIWLN